MSAPSEGWANHATVMGYYLHRLKNRRSLCHGREIKGGTHGFLRHKTWHFASQAKTQNIDFSGGEMTFPRNELPGSYILELVDVPMREFCYADLPSGRWVTIDLTGVPYLTLWSDRRTVSLPGTVLGTDRSSRTARF